MYAIVLQHYLLKSSNIKSMLFEHGFPLSCSADQCDHVVSLACVFEFEYFINRQKTYLNSNSFVFLDVK